MSVSGALADLQKEGVENYLRNREILPLHELDLIPALKTNIAALPVHRERENAVRILEHMAGRHFVLAAHNPAIGHLSVYAALVNNFAQPTEEILVEGSDRLRGTFYTAAHKTAEKIRNLIPRKPREPLSIEDITRVMSMSPLPT